MKSKKNLLEQLKVLPYFGKNSVRQLGKQLELKDVTVDTYISRFLKNKEIFQLKKGLYVSSDFFNENKGDISYLYYLANIIRTPSYISSWTALQYYNLTTEVVYSVISVTPKVTREYRTKAGDFAYHSIKGDLFSEFSLAKGKFDFFIASPSKALFDLLYLRTSQFRGVSFDDIKTLVDELRIDIDEMDKAEQVKFYEIIKKHLHE